MLFLKQPLIFPFLCNKSATIDQIDSNMVSNSQLKPDLSNCAKTAMIESTAPPQQLHKTVHSFLGDTLQKWLIRLTP